MTLSVRIRHSLPGFTLDAAFDAPPGLTVLHGPSGAGKSSVVNAVAGLLRPEAGRIAVGGRVLFDRARGIDLPSHRRRLGYVFQEGRLFPHLTVRQNLLYGWWMAGRPPTGPRLDEIVEMLGIAPLLPRRPGALSGGERSRVAIGRALLAGPSLILADEPLAALDEARKAEILPCFERLRDAGTVPILYVSHATAEIARLASTVVLMQAGRVMASGPPAQMLGGHGSDMAVCHLPARVEGVDRDGLTRLRVAGGTVHVAGAAGSAGTSVMLRIAARDVILSLHRPEGLSALNILKGRVAAITAEGGATARVRLDLGGVDLSVQVMQRSVVAMGLSEGRQCHAIIASVAIAAADTGPDGRA